MFNRYKNSKFWPLATGANIDTSAIKIPEELKGNLSFLDLKTRSK